MANNSKLNAIHSSYLLDEAWSPVARFRLLSGGINDNARLENNAQVNGDRACLACGNCVDACPVVRQNVGLVFNQNQRTSMALENYVQEECRRCYRCVNSCPQVSKSLKEYASGFRRVEKIVHLMAAFFIVSLAATGVIRAHYAIVLGGFEADVLKYAHRALGICSIIIPILYYRLDIKHFRRTVKRIFSWGMADLQWFKNTALHILSPKSNKTIARNEFNPGQKVWYLFIMSVFPLLYLSGLGALFTSSAVEGNGQMNSKLFHMVFALSFDLMLFVHIYLKFIRQWISQSYKLVKNYIDTKSLVFRGN
jgi:cytochrome b subunit of formate dehydrogenase